MRLQTEISTTLMVWVRVRVNVRVGLICEKDGG